MNNALIAALSAYERRFEQAYSEIDEWQEHVEITEQEQRAESAWERYAESWPDEADPEELWARQNDRQYNASYVPERDAVPEIAYCDQFEEARAKLDAQYTPVLDVLLCAIVMRFGREKFFLIALADDAAEMVRDVASYFNQPKECPF